MCGGVGGVGGGQVLKERIYSCRSKFFPLSFSDTDANAKTLEVISTQNMADKQESVFIHLGVARLGDGAGEVSLPGCLLVNLKKRGACRRCNMHLAGHIGVSQCGFPLTL